MGWDLDQSGEASQGEGNHPEGPALNTQARGDVEEEKQGCQNNVANIYPRPSWHKILFSSALNKFDNMNWQSNGDNRQWNYWGYWKNK